MHHVISVESGIPAAKNTSGDTSGGIFDKNTSVDMDGMDNIMDLLLLPLDLPPLPPPHEGADDFLDLQPDLPPLTPPHKGTDNLLDLPPDLSPLSPPHICAAADEDSVIEDAAAEDSTDDTMSKYCREMLVRSVLDEHGENTFCNDQELQNS